MRERTEKLEAKETGKMQHRKRCVSAHVNGNNQLLRCVEEYNQPSRSK